MQIERQGTREEGRTPEGLSDRLWNFAARVGKVVDALPDTRMGRHVAGQLVRCGTSAAPNYDEACAAESRADFAHKVSVALKEAKETRGWLRFTWLAGLLPAKRTTGVFDECEQICKILGKSVVTARQNTPASPRRSRPSATM